MAADRPNRLLGSIRLSNDSLSPGPSFKADWFFVDRRCEDRVSLRIIRRKIRSGLIRAGLAWDAIERSFQNNGDLVLDKLKVQWERFRPPLPRPSSHRPDALPDREISEALRQTRESFYKTVTAIGASASWPIADRHPERRVVVVANDGVLSDIRIERQAQTLAKRGYDIVVVGVASRVAPIGAVSLPDWGPRVEFDILPASALGDLRGPPFFYSTSMIEAAAAHGAFAIQATDLSNALIVVEAARRTGALAILDLPTWESENTSRDAKTARWLLHDEALAAALREIESLVLRRSAAAITSSETLARAMEKAAGVDEGFVEVVSNAPDPALRSSQMYRPLKEQSGLTSDKFVVVCQADANTFTMLHPVITSLTYLPDVHLVVRVPSTGPARRYYRRIARQAGASKRLVLLDPVPPRDLISASMGADVGLWTQPNISKNHRSALPVEIFAYTGANLPLAAAQYPEATKWLQKYKAGVAFDPYDPRSIAGALEKLRDQKIFFSERVAEAKQALFEKDVENDWRKYSDVYDRLWSAATSRFEEKTTAQSSSSTPMRVLHAPCNFGNQSWVLSRAERQLGLKSELVVNYLNAFDQPADRVLGKVGGRTTNHLIARKTALWAAPYDFDVFHYYFGRSLASWDDIDELAGESFDDLKRARELGKPVIMTLQGCDVRLAGESNRRNTFTPCAPHRCPAYASCLATYDDQRRRLIRDILPLCDKVFYLNPELGHFVPDATFLPYANVDISKVHPQPRAANALPRILHAPSLAGIKGTSAILAALESLAKRHAFELVLVQNQTHQEAMAIYQTADIAIDQIFAGWYGGLSVELMAMGIPVMSYLREDDFVRAPAAMIRDLPIINIRPDSLEKDIEAVLMRRAEWAEIGRASRSFVEKWHDPMKIAAWMIEVYKDPKNTFEFDPDTA